jgi:5-methylcytosine-specific restriction endonuclease McrA
MEQSTVPASAHGEPETAEELISRLRALRAERRARKAAQKQLARRRRALSFVERQRVHAKMAGRCHICGGIVDEGWQADHVLAHSGGGVSEADNYLAAHALCNNYRWDYLPQEFQTILKLGVWARTQIERNTSLGQQLASAFVAYEKIRRNRRRSTAVPVER